MLKKKWVILALLLTALMSDAAAEAYYYNPEGGTRYHADANCVSTSSQYLPMTQLDAGVIDMLGLRACQVCINEPGQLPRQPAGNMSLAPLVNPLAGMYFNPDGGTRYHMDAACRSVDEQYRPMLPATQCRAEQLTPCHVCAGTVDAYWYKGENAAYYHRGSCTLGETAPEQKTAVNMRWGTLVTAGADYHGLAPCPVCCTEERDTFVYSLSSRYHQSIQCPGVSNQDRWLMVIGAVPCKEQLAKSWQACSLCMGTGAETVVAWYNQNGGEKLHRVRGCSSISAQNMAYMVGVAESELETLMKTMGKCRVCWK